MERDYNLLLTFSLLVNMSAAVAQ